MERDLNETSANLRRLAQEVDETRRRMVIGGTFYVLCWLLVCLFTPVVRVYPWTTLGVAVAFLGLAVARVVLKPPVSDDAAVLTRWLDGQWIIIQSSAALWGGVVFWTLICETVIWDMLTRAFTPTSRTTAAMVTAASKYPADTDMPK